MPNRPRLLIIDECQDFGDSLSPILSRSFQTLLLHPAVDSPSKILETRPDLILIVNSSEDELWANALHLCRKIRDHRPTEFIPLVILSSRNSVEDRIQAFRAGFDDFLAQPFFPEELIARLWSKLRHKLSPRVFKYKTLSLDCDTLRATINGEPLALSVLEFNLVKFFVQNQGKIINRETILQTIWKNCTVSPRTVDTHIAVLRKKIPHFPDFFETVYGAGYILHVDAS